MLAAGLRVKNCPCLSKQTWSMGTGETGSSAFLPPVCRQGDDERNRQKNGKGQGFLDQFDLMLSSAQKVCLAKFKRDASRFRRQPTMPCFPAPIRVPNTLEM